MPINAWLWWSGGKDSAWALHVLDRTSDVEVVALAATINEVRQRVPLHEIRRELLEQQADAVGIPLRVIEIPYPCRDAEYDAIMREEVEEARRLGVRYMVFGDLSLQAVRERRENKLAGTGIRPLFPLWGVNTARLAGEMISSGLRAIVTSVDLRQLPPTFVGREYNDSFLDDLPDTVDPCGERGEFHSFAFEGPMFRKPVDVRVGEILTEDGFVFADLLPRSLNRCTEPDQEDSRLLGGTG